MQCCSPVAAYAGDNTVQCTEVQKKLALKKHHCTPKVSSSIQKPSKNLEQDLQTGKRLKRGCQDKQAATYKFINYFVIRGLGLLLSFGLSLSKVSRGSKIGEAGWGRVGVKGEQVSG